MGPSLAAFQLRSQDKGSLSVTEVEQFGPNTPATRVKAAMAHRETLRDKRLPSQGIFARATVTAIHEAGLAADKKFRVVRDPVPGNKAHAEIRRFAQPEELDFLEGFASRVFAEYEVVAEMNIPVRTP